MDEQSDNAQTTQATPAPQPAETNSASKSSSSKGVTYALVGVVVVFLCCLVCSVIFALFGYLEADEDCVYRGPFAPESDYCVDEEDNDEDEDRDEEDEDRDEDEDEDRDNDSNGIVPPPPPSGNDSTPSAEGLVEYDGIFYMFEHPDNWSVDSGVDGVTLTGPNGTDNFIVTEVYDNEFEVSSDSCEEYGEGLVAGLETVYDDVTLIGTRDTSVASSDACRVELDGSLLGVELKQVQYYVVDDVISSFAYILTLTADDNNAGLRAMEDMVDSFEIN